VSSSSPALPVVKVSTPHSDGVAKLGKSLSQPVSSTSSVSKSQLQYAQRVKEKVAKQLNKNKEGYSKEVLDMMNVAPVVGMSWGGDDKKLLDLFSVTDKREQKAKGMRELKNLDCSISPMKHQRRRGLVGSKHAFSFPAEVH
jgi:hypothetical protein